MNAARLLALVPLSVLAACGPLLARMPGANRCGTLRWDVKTLSDPAANRVAATGQPTTVAALAALPRPAGIGRRSPRTNPDEERRYQLEGVWLIQANVQGDRDIHLIVADRNDRSVTMILEFPDVTCDGASASTFKAQMQAARAELDRRCGPFRRGAWTVFDDSASGTFEGIAFFDERHNQHGAPANGVELHPVLAVAALPAPPRKCRR